MKALYTLIFSCLATTLAPTARCEPNQEPKPTPVITGHRVDPETGERISRYSAPGQEQSDALESDSVHKNLSVAAHGNVDGSKGISEKNNPRTAGSALSGKSNHPGLGAATGSH